MTEPLTRQETAAYKLSLKDLTNDLLFKEWSEKYDAKDGVRVPLIIAEMNTRDFDNAVIQL